MADVTITVPVDNNNRLYTFRRDQLATAMLLWLEHGNARLVLNALRNDHGIVGVEALRLALAAPRCVDAGIEP